MQIPFTVDWLPSRVYCNVGLVLGNYVHWWHAWNAPNTKGSANKYVSHSHQPGFFTQNYHVDFLHNFKFKTQGLERFMQRFGTTQKPDCYLHLGFSGSPRGYHYYTAKVANPHSILWPLCWLGEWMAGVRSVNKLLKRHMKCAFHILPTLQTTVCVCV